MCRKTGVLGSDTFVVKEPFCPHIGSQPYWVKKRGEHKHCASWLIMSSPLSKNVERLVRRFVYRNTYTELTRIHLSIRTYTSTNLWTIVYPQRDRSIEV